MNNRNKRSDPDSELYSAILKLQTVEECYDFFTEDDRTLKRFVCSARKAR